MKKLVIDMDDVITCYNFEKTLKKYLGYEYDFSNFTGYRMQDVLGDDKPNFFNWLKDQNYYEEAELSANCYEVIKDLNEIYELYILTDYVWPEKEIHPYLGEFINDKYNFLYKKLDFLKPNQFIFSANKKIVKADIKIDDKITNLIGAKTKLMYTAYHNKNITDEELKKKKVIRVNNWLDIEKVLVER
jgi:5'(3')-deoxyribonucleotidase